MQQHDFNLFANKIKAEGKLTTKQALDKFIKAMMQGPKLKIVKKKTIRKLVDGVRIYPDGHEICKTKASWQKRVDELFERDKIDDEQSQQYWRCAGCRRPSEFYGNFDPDHIYKRSVGRDDRLCNLQLLGRENFCNCHGKKHDEFKKRGAGQ